LSCDHCCQFLWIAPSVFGILHRLFVLWPLLSVPLGCPFLIAPSVFGILHRLFVMWPLLSVPLDCPFLIAPSVFGIL
jgi:hypothetical protein